MLTDADQAFADALALRGVTVKPAAPNYLEEPRDVYHGRPGFVALPSDTDQVSEVVKACAAAGVGIQPYGGGTGLVGGQVSSEGPVPLIVSLERMNRVRAIYPEEDTIVLDAGVTVSEAQAAAEAAGRLFPVSYGSQDSARIGGGLAVNSGGLNVLRYGMVRDVCLGIEAVLPDGSILNGLKRLRKDNTGYDLRHLLIGSEGTLGIITGAAMRLFPRPAQIATAFLVVRDPGAAIALLTLFRQRAGEAVSAFELISRTNFDMMAETHPEARQPFETFPEWAILTELGTGPGADPEEMMTALFEDAFEAGLVSDGAVAQSGQQRADFWHFRETIPEANRRIGAIASHDISLPLSELAGFIAEAPEAIAAIAPGRIACFGHLGDGNLHYNLFPQRGDTRDAYMARSHDVSDLVHEMVVARGGSFSAEHGVGRKKVGELQRWGDPAKLAAMRAIKTALDPKGIMNPGAVLPLL
ncbi:FAD-binding oxidoreductase [Silicimonas algicola]|uniref:FAD/FMN-containing dehydrogenase n=1 Tax=Silicimonas algicola TaxID=1826607 RepID=A0A316GDI0_9RHOB|nr:FAD-binding oxidoreductase [Silicimonas algicola]AZQ65992.1 FAD-binding oxidoreductase [Silicimonas algicola]PWK58285.1 FAD/FMN-containing dehydrogenase [Silicimonas algicola]